MTEHRISRAEDLPPGESIVTEVNGLSIGVFNVDGDFYALSNRCPHQQGPLCEGTLKRCGTAIADSRSGFRPELRLGGDVVACPWHQLEFRVSTGECLALPDMDVPTYDVAVRDGDLYVDL